MKLIFKGLGTSGSEPCAYRFWHLSKRNAERLTLEAVGKRVCESDQKAPGQWRDLGRGRDLGVQPQLDQLSQLCSEELNFEFWGESAFLCLFPPSSLPACYLLYGFRPKWTSILPSKCEYSLLPRAVAAQLLPYGFWEPTVSIVGERRV